MKDQPTKRELKLATKIWNAIDHMEGPEPFWELMLLHMPWAFSDQSDANSIKFTR